MATTIRLDPIAEAALERLVQLDNVSKNVAISRAIVEADLRRTRSLAFDAMMTEEANFFAGLIDRLKHT